MTKSYPKKGTIAWMILNIIKHSRSRGIQKCDIMSTIFLVMGKKDYSITKDRGKFSSYFTKNTYQYGVVPMFCTKVGTRWIYNYHAGHK